MNGSQLTSMIQKPDTNAVYGRSAETFEDNDTCHQDLRRLTSLEPPTPSSLAYTFKDTQMKQESGRYENDSKYSI